MEIKKITVIGAGIMGSGITQVCAQAGFDVAMKDIKDEFIERGLKGINKNVGRQVQKGKISQEVMDEILGKIQATTDLKEAVKDTSIVIEAATENMEIKKAIFKELEEVCDEEVIFASNTTALSIGEMGSVTKRPDKVIGMHFFNPAPVMRLIEVIRAIDTSDDTFDTVYKLSEKLGKRPIGLKESAGFIVTRIFAVMINEALYTLMEGVASPEEIDQAMKLGVNLPMGPLETLDMMGLDVGVSTLETLQREFGDPKYRPCPLLRQYARAGRLGIKTGKGIYDYSKKGR
ncbi:MAG: 3-hydroxyacyl-CoA dehydrogenase NAD-binding domain-containing protein [Thermodesulfobacteriota bacterium]|nr:3-hydroxyacyl-CoA dehydrogenase NAD-binding domain-containing protein [Thermodesulfobacteriota bacterium]